MKKIKNDQNDVPDASDDKNNMKLLQSYKSNVDYGSKSLETHPWEQTNTDSHHR